MKSASCGATNNSCPGKFNRRSKRTINSSNPNRHSNSRRNNFNNCKSKNTQLVQQTQEQQDDLARKQCINNLRQLDGAIQQWALENKQPANARVTINELLPYLGNSAAPVCPSGGVYSLTTVSAQPTCNIPGHTLAQ